MGEFAGKEILLGWAMWRDDGRHGVRRATVGSISAHGARLCHASASATNSDARAKVGREEGHCRPPDSERLAW